MDTLSTLSPITHQLVDELKKQKLTVTTVESCTGGLIGALLTSVSGSSSVYDGGFVTYSNEMKMHMVQVQKETLSKHGAVSSQTAIEMATGGCEQTKADIAISVTGVAGPTGGSEEKPVGLVWFGINHKGNVKSEKMIFDGDRTSVRQQACAHALHLILSCCK